MRPAPFERLRRNHAIEHAAMHMLARGLPHPRLVARSDWNGFSFYGDIETPRLVQAIQQGIGALETGHDQLAIHPRCGSNMAATILLSSATVWLAIESERRRKAPWNSLITLVGMVSAVLLGQPLGRLLQKHMLTSPQMDGAHIARVDKSRLGQMTVHRVEISYD